MRTPRLRLLALTLALSTGCDEASAPETPTPEEPARVPVSDALRAQALERADELEAAGRPERDAWERATAALAAPADEACPADALAVPREEHLVVQHAADFHTDVQADVLDILLARYGRSFAQLDQAERLRLFAGRDDGALLAETLAETATPRPPRNVVVLVVDALEQARRVGDDSFESGELRGRAYLLAAPDFHVVCALPVLTENGDSVEAERFGSLSMFDARALLELFERAERDVDARLASRAE